MVEVRRVLGLEEALLPGLSALLRGAVEGGASVGFLSPLSPATAAAYWRGLLSSLGDGSCLWIAEDAGVVVGSVQLERCGKENGRHRAEIRKFFVDRRYRGRGIASKLMAAAESYARSAGLTLLVLDTEKGSLAESVYRHLGWERSGEIPDYAMTPDGRLHPTVYYFKRLAP